MKLAFIDLDGVVVNASVRFQRAEDLRKAHPFPTSKEAYNQYWRDALDPAYCHLDTLIEGAAEHLENLRRDGYGIIYLSSRPESMRKATATWLREHGAWNDSDLLVLKAPSFQFQKTIAWYGWQAETFACAYEARELVVVSDKQANLDSMRTVLTRAGFQARFHKSLADVFAPAQGPDEQGDPFLPAFPEEDAE